ncbi:MAG: hypothetical protein ACK4UN_00435, partial [Limisphaerales bacterium]
MLLPILLAHLILNSVSVQAYTLSGAAGEAASGGTIISKNRERKPDHTQVLKMRRGENTSDTPAFQAIQCEGIYPEHLQGICT